MRLISHRQSSHHPHPHPPPTEAVFLRQKQNLNKMIDRLLNVVFNPTHRSTQSRDGCQAIEPAPTPLLQVARLGKHSASAGYSA